MLDEHRLAASVEDFGPDTLRDEALEQSLRAVRVSSRPPPPPSDPEALDEFMGVGIPIDLLHPDLDDWP